jgi:hypothetical protein
VIEGYKNVMASIIAIERMIEVKRKEQERLQENLKLKKEKEIK